jgi:hypothetical protein
MNTVFSSVANLLTETTISLSQAARRLPSFRNDRPVSPATIWRWDSEGVRLPNGTRLRLEAVRLGGRWITSVESLTRFSERQTQAQTPSHEPPLSIRTPGQINTASERAEKQLEEIGI